MSATITIGGTDHTDKFGAFELRILKNKRTFNNIRATLKAPNFTIEEGEEVQATIDTFLEFGGLLQSVKNIPNTVQNKYVIYATGYEQITDRRTITLTYENTDAGDIVNDLVTILAGEGITVGNIDTGAEVSITKGAISIRDVMDELALASGYVWFIDNDKKLYFQDDYNYTPGIFPTDYEVVEVGRSLVGYANKIFVVGANGIVATAENTAEQTKMAGRFGSGVYGVIVRDAQADTQAKADAVATVELAKRDFDKKYVYIKTRTRIDVGTIYTGVTIPYTDISGEDYAVDEVVIEGKGDGYWYTAKLEPYDTTQLSKNDSWQNKFREFLNKANTEVDFGSGNVFVQPEEPAGAPENSLWVDTDDLSNCDIPLITGSQAINLDDGYVIYVSGAGVTLSLPLIDDVFNGTDAGQDTAGCLLRIKNIDPSNAVTIAPTSTDTIEGITTYSLTAGTGKEFIAQRTLTDWKVM